MNSALLFIVLIVALLAGCGVRGSNTETKIAPEMPIPSAEKPAPGPPQPAYGLPLDIQIEVPDVPQAIRGPSPPIPEGTPPPSGILMDFGTQKKK
jgi:hypothetical protein